MDTAMLIELVGYLGSALVLISMTMSSVVRLRLINMIGSAIFAAYAVVIHSYPTAFMNGCLVLINLSNLLKMTRKDKHYDLIEERADGAFITYFWKYYREDIRKYFPDFDFFQSRKNGRVYVACCDTVPAGFLIGEDKGDGMLEIVADYSTPAYRDCSVGKYLYSKLTEYGIQKLVCSAVQVPRHKEYLMKMGFESDQTGGYQKIL